MAELTDQAECKWIVFGNVQLFARRNEEGQPVRADAINENESAIRALADRLQKAGYGVMRQRVSRAGRIYYRLRAIWAAPGAPPDNPLSFSGESP
jgi:hypothetical protein